MKWLIAILTAFFRALLPWVAKQSRPTAEDGDSDTATRNKLRSKVRGSNPSRTALSISTAAPPAKAIQVAPAGSFQAFPCVAQVQLSSAVFTCEHRRNTDNSRRDRRTIRDQTERGAWSSLWRPDAMRS